MFNSKKPAGVVAAQAAKIARHRFRLVRYFSLAALGLFTALALALTYFEHEQEQLFQDVQQKQAAFFKQVQESSVTQQDMAARRDLLAVNEAGTVTMTRLFANTLWERDFAPFVAKAHTIPVDACRALADVKNPKDGKISPSPEKKACFAEVGKQMMELKEFAPINAKVYNLMKSSSVFKIKLFDLRGITVYSSEHHQIGEDKIATSGWKTAAIDGKPSSSISFRGKFNAFQGVVENRDLIGSYMPLLAPGTENIVAVLEVYTDVTQFLNQIKASSALLSKTANDYQANVEATAMENQEKVKTSGQISLLIELGLLVVLFIVLYAIVRRADKIMAAQENDREHVQQQLAQSAKMASLGQMVAGVAHQLNTPLAFSHNNVSMAINVVKGFSTPLKVTATLVDLTKSTDADIVNLNIAKFRTQIEGIDQDNLNVEMPLEMLGDTLRGIDQMRELVENLRDFTRLDRSKTAAFDLNKGLHNVIYIARSVIPTHIKVVEEFGELPKIECNASQLNEVFLNLINNAAQSIVAEQGTVTVRSRMDGSRIRVDVIDTGAGIAPDVLPYIFDNYYTTKAASEGTGLGLAIARNIVEEHGGEIKVSTELGKGSTFTVFLSVAQT